MADPALLGELIAAEIGAVALVFARLGTAAMLLPGLGETVVPARVRLVAALLLSLLLAPVVGPPAAEPGPPALLAEIVTGAFLGIAGRLVLIAIQITGHIVAVQSGIAMATVFDPMEASGGTAPSALLGATGIVVLFATDLHHLALSGLAASFTAIAPGTLADPGELALALMRLADTSARVGLELAAPVLLAGLLAAAGLGLMSRLMPMLPVFFVAVPAQILGVFALLAIAIGSILTAFTGSIDSFGDALARSG